MCAVELPYPNSVVLSEGVLSPRGQVAKSGGILVVTTERGTATGI